MRRVVIVVVVVVVIIISHSAGGFPTVVHLNELLLSDLDVAGAQHRSRCPLREWRTVLAALVAIHDLLVVPETCGEVHRIRGRVDGVVIGIGMVVVIIAAVKRAWTLCSITRRKRVTWATRKNPGPRGSKVRSCVQYKELGYASCRVLFTGTKYELLLQGFPLGLISKPTKT